VSSSVNHSATAAVLDSIAVVYGYTQGADLLGLGATTMISDFSELLGLIEL
jgi:phosphoglycolate phosphatase-like HAD superfamily hydrolase